jgi:hypothetical protein
MKVEKGAIGPSSPWVEEEEDAFSGNYANRLALEHARAMLVCRLVDRVEIVKRANILELMAEGRRQLVEASAEGRHEEIKDLILQAFELEKLQDD